MSLCMQSASAMRLEYLVYSAVLSVSYGATVPESGGHLRIVAYRAYRVR